jgi:hypothetical protein
VTCAQIKSLDLNRMAMPRYDYRVETLGHRWGEVNVELLNILRKKAAGTSQLQASSGTIQSNPEGLGGSSGIRFRGATIRTPPNREVKPVNPNFSNSSNSSNDSKHESYTRTYSFEWFKGVWTDIKFLVGSERGPLAEENFLVAYYPTLCLLIPVLPLKGSSN